MDEHRFDALARSLAAPKSRRGFLVGLGALAASVMGITLADAGQSACPPGQTKNRKGDCSCPPGTDACPDGCFDKKRDLNNCGKCGRTCTGGECRKGECRCPSGTKLCDGACRDQASYASDPINCGRCGRVCDGVCEAGACVALDPVPCQGDLCSAANQETDFLLLNRHLAAQGFVMAGPAPLVTESGSTVLIIGYPDSTGQPGVQALLVYDPQAPVGSRSYVLTWSGTTLLEILGVAGGQVEGVDPAQAAALVAPLGKAAPAAQSGSGDLCQDCIDTCESIAQVAVGFPLFLVGSAVCAVVAVASCPTSLFGFAFRDPSCVTDTWDFCQRVSGVVGDLTESAACRNECSNPLFGCDECGAEGCPDESACPALPEPQCDYPTLGVQREQCALPTQVDGGTTDNICSSLGQDIDNDFQNVFTDDCRFHDCCWSECGADRGQCDLDFKGRLEATCGREFPGTENQSRREDCLAAALAIYVGVSTPFGTAGYNKIQNAVCGCCDDWCISAGGVPCGGACRFCPSGQIDEATCKCDESQGCSDGQSRCDDRCIDTTYDIMNCGACGNICFNGPCMDGACIDATLQPCIDGQTLCDGNCVDTTSDLMHCGACGNACTNGPCMGGGCVVPTLEACIEGQTLCDGQCTDTSSDPYNCGGCGVVCASVECSRGVCANLEPLSGPEGTPIT